MLGVSKEASWIRRYRDRIDMVKLICLKPGNGRLSCSVESYMVEFMELCGVTEKGGDEDDSILGNGGPPRSGASTYKAWRRKKEAKLSQKPKKEKTRGTPQDLETEASKRLKGSQEGSAAEQRARRRQERSI
ncbi:hypothetical protein F2Q69_00014163 [Brassica cretica]|uniref:Uncharacterized protein n=1 Tax=Brassica cretica TaxID=69181 RepID=A0A8S9QW65_BRACR|nr:hypothetical protein F2Q69_00014163 [Brassica cretica]